MKDSFPVVEVLLTEWRIEAVGVASGGNICWRRTFAEHLLNGISWDEMDEQEDERDD